MNLFRLILLAVAGYFFWRLLAPGFRQVPPPPRRDEREAPFEPMQRCAGCGTYLPVSSLSRSGRCGRCSE